MTLGQRIAQKRKELGLSQEGLGEQLGVSRQAIYKWESDASLPEIDKLITLSKIFSVSVGWLLGVEEAPSPAEPPSGELTEAQLQMVQEIVDRYLAAQPKQAPLKRRKLVRLCGAAAVLALVVALFNLFSKLDRVTQDYNNLRCSVDNVSNSVNSQINSITYRVENILKSQNSLTAEYSTELASTDLGANTATFDIRVVPKTYVDGMTALFVARSEEETVELPVEPGEDHAFSGEITCPLTDDISLTVVLVTGDKRETQWLEDYGYLYSGSFPDLSLDSQLWFDMVHRKDNLLPASQAPEIQVENYGEGGIGSGAGVRSRRPPSRWVCSRIRSWSCGMRSGRRKSTSTASPPPSPPGSVPGRWSWTPTASTARCCFTPMRMAASESMAPRPSPMTPGRGAGAALPSMITARIRQIGRFNPCLTGHVVL